jgi:hypothetical protein
VSPSKLDARQRARDFRVDPDQTREARHRGGRKKLHHVFKDLTTVTYLQNRDTEDSRYIVLDELPEMTEDWIEKMVVVRSPVGGAPDRMYLGVENPDDSLTWIELSLAASAPPNTGNAPPPADDPTGITWERHYIGNFGLLPSTSWLTDLIGVAVAGDQSSGSADFPIWATDPVGTRTFSLNPSTGARIATVTLTHPTGVWTDAGQFAFLVDSRQASGLQSQVLGRAASNGVANSSTNLGVSNVQGGGYSPGTSPYQHYICDRTGVRVRRFRSSDGVVLENITHANLVNPTDASANSKLFVTDATRHVVHVFSLTGGTLLGTIGVANTPGSANGSFNVPMGVWTDRLGRVFIADMNNQRVQVFKESDFSFVAKFGTAGDGDAQFRNPSGIGGRVQVDGSTLIYVLDAGTPGATAPRVSAWEVAGGLGA